VTTSDCAGNATVPVANCGEERSYSHPKTEMKFSEFSDYMKTRDDRKETVLYLKDWHCQRHVSFCHLCHAVWVQL